jgi:hypothetical protein
MDEHLNINCDDRARFACWIAFISSGIDM